MDKTKALQVFGLPPSFSEEDLKQKWRKLAKKYHPDISNDAEKFIQLKETYEFLQNYRLQYPTEQDWEELFTYDGMYDVNTDDIWVTSNGNIDLVTNTERTLLYTALFFSLAAILFIFIQITENYFVHVLWYQLSLGITTISSSISAIRFLLF